MYTRLHIQRKSSFSSVSQSTKSWFRQRPFKDNAAVPQETPGLQPQTDKTTRFSHNFSRVQIDDSIPAGIQTKLAIGNPGDRYEQEADSVADQEQFQDGFTQSWVEQQIKELKDLQAQGNLAQNKKQEIRELKKIVDSINKRRSQLDKYAKFGFLNLDQALVDALIKAKMEWGGAWIKSKDFMHFELPKY